MQHFSRPKRLVAWVVYAIVIFGSYETGWLRHSSLVSSSPGRASAGIQPAPDAHDCQHLVFRCMDFRIRHAVEEWIDTDPELHGVVDELVWPGVSVLINDEDTQASFLKTLALAQRLHGTTVVHLVNHRDCGGHGGSRRYNHDLAAEYEHHVEELSRAMGILKAHFPALTFRAHFVELVGEVQVKKDVVR